MVVPMGFRPEVKPAPPIPKTGPWLGRPDPTGLFAGIYYQFARWRDLSDVIQHPHSGELLFVDDNKKRRLYRMAAGGLMQADGPLLEMAIPGEIRLDDPESLTVDDQGLIYVCSSHALKKRKSKRIAALLTPQPLAFARFRLADDQVLVEDGLITNLREALCVQYDLVQRIELLPPQKGGLNIEGLGFDPVQKRFFIGLRSPLLDDYACLLPFQIDAQAEFSVNNLKWQDPIRLEIPAKGVRAIQYDERLKAFLILAGNVRKGSGHEFALWLWDGNSEGRCQHIEAVTFRDYFNPEGVCRVNLPNGEDFIFIVSDNGGGYMKLRYEELKL